MRDKMTLDDFNKEDLADMVADEQRENNALRTALAESQERFKQAAKLMAEYEVALLALVPEAMSAEESNKLLTSPGWAMVTVNAAKAREAASQDRVRVLTEALERALPQLAGMSVPRGCESVADIIRSALSPDPSAPKPDTDIKEK